MLKTELQKVNYIRRNSRCKNSFGQTEALKTVFVQNSKIQFQQLNNLVRTFIRQKNGRKLMLKKTSLIKTKSP